jgi:3-phosphoshikimate 1-carboxyvinyltransferase
VTTTQIKPVKSLSGIISVPGDKSISHRYAILGALAEGPTHIENFSPAADCASTLACIERLGVVVEQKNNNVVVRGAGLRGLRAPRRKLDAENSGTTMRLLTGVLSGQRFESVITGDASLRRRPMRRVIEPLTQMGAQIAARHGEFAPLEIRGAALHSIPFALPIPSAQVKSAILLAGLCAEGETHVIESVRTRDHTELALAEFGADVATIERTVRLHGPARLEGRSLRVPGDISSAAFLLGAALARPDSQVVVRCVGLNPTRTAVLDFLASMGAPIQLTELSMRHGELVGDVSVRHAPLRGGVVRGEAVAQMIDELPLLAALGPYTEEGIEIRDARELRVKESDRIAALAENLRRMGAEVEEFDDGVRVAGRLAGALRGAEIDPRGDHRIAMALAVAALGARGETLMRNAECVQVSYPGFFEALRGLCGENPR